MKKSPQINLKTVIRAGLATGLVVTMLSACDAPRDRRFNTSKKPTYYTTPSFSGFTTGSNSNTEGQTPGSGTGTGGGQTPIPDPEQSTPSNVPADAAQCTWSADGTSNFRYNHAHLGDYNFCQSNANETIFYFQLKTIKDPDGSSFNTCFIPTTNQNNSSTYVGEPRCIRATSSTNIYKIQMYKNRQNFGSYPITGSMIMKDKLYWYGQPYYQNMLAPDAYLYCIQWLTNTGDSSYCTSFSQTGQHVYHQF